MNEVNQKNKRPIAGCAFQIFSGVLICGFWLGVILITEFDNWLFSYFVIISIYILYYARYIFIKPTLESFYLGRQLCFLTFPCFSNMILLFFWYQTHSWPISVISSIILGWFISKGLQKTLFAYEFTHRDNDRDTIDTEINEYKVYDPFQSYQLNIQGIELAKEGDFKRAQEKFERAIEFDPYNPNPRISISNILIHYDRFTEAENQLNKALQLNPTKVNEQNIYNNLANLYVAKKNFSLALKYYKKSISVYKADHEIYYNLALCLEQLGDWDEALNYFKLSDKNSANKKAQLGIMRVKQRIVKKPEMIKILNSYKDIFSHFPFCGNSSLNHDKQKKIEILCDSSLVFFVGAGISSPYPSCLPKASEILKVIFKFLFEIDREEISEMLQVRNEKEAYKKICLDFNALEENAPGESLNYLPFESTFQALYDSFGFPVVRFVDLLSIGSYNLHHQMLACAVKKGHTVITTNFDKKIEAAFNDDNITVLISDKDFQHAIDNSLYDGVLAKIHGDISDYSSLALTMAGVAVGSDRSMFVGDDIEKEKGEHQMQLINPKTFLSIPKALWLQNVLKKKKILVMGYSGSDQVDIMPILTDIEHQCKGIWISYEYKLPKSVKTWAEVDKERIILKPKNEKEEADDLPSKVSRYFLNQFRSEQKIDIEKKNDVHEIQELINSNFKSWIDSLRLRPGDGLVFMGRLHSQRGLWQQAETFYSKAMQKYEKDVYSNESRWLVTKSNLGYVLDYLNKAEDALKIALEIREYIEQTHKQDLYPDIYANNLINIAGKLINSNRDYEAGLLVSQAMKIAEEINDNQLSCYGLRIVADRYLGKKDFKKALEIYLQVYKLASDVFGDIRESCLASMHAAICLAHLGNQYSAYDMIRHAREHANYLNDKELIDHVEHNRGFISSFFMGKSNTLHFHEEMINKAKMQMGKKLEKEIDELKEHIEFEMYDQSLKMINRLLDNYHHVDIQSLLYFIKSNVYHRKHEFEKEIEALYELNKLKPNFPLAEHNLGNAFSQLRKYNDAEKHFSKAIELMGGNYPLAYCNLGLMYCDMNRKKDAKELLEKVRKMDPPENSLSMLKKRISELDKEEHDDVSRP
jgi:tetratricopeptide (TPR) repeat protein